MKPTITYIKTLSALFTIFCTVAFTDGQSIFSNSIDGDNPNTDNPYILNQFVTPNITVSGIGRGTGITGKNKNDRYTAIDWNKNAFDANDYFEFIITPNLGFEIDFISFEYFGQTNKDGPKNIVIRNSIDSFSSNIGTPNIKGQNIIDLSSYQDISTAIVFRIYAWGGKKEDKGEFSINDFIFNGSINTTTCFSCVYTWEAGGWNRTGVPSINNPVIINAPYNTAIEGSFRALSATVNAGQILTIGNDSFIEIENDIVVDGSMIVKSKGSIKQNNPTATVTENGSIQIIKTTALTNAYYEYTYWSSPVSTETIGGGLAESQPGNRYSFNAANFVDSVMESNNNNGTVTGQDDIDDNGDDWTPVSNGTIMTPGIGYVSMHSSNNFTGNGTQYDYTFDGPFNNGPITVPIFRNDLEVNDTNWNLIGNPYPSAIDVDLFFAANTIITPDNSNVSYQTSHGNNIYNTGITYVELNGIGNQDLDNTNNNGYEDATNVEIPVTRGSSYNLNVKVNTGGDYTSHTFAWIDWNRDGDFNDSNENYDLGADTNKYDILIESSPYTIEVPSFAVIGTTRMRISSKYNGDPGSDETGFDGEVEDYSIIVSNNSGGLDNVLFLWSQNTPPSNNNNGNEQSNFSSSDYAVINGAGETAGGDGVIPSRHIPSGQSFFVSFSDDVTPSSSSGNIGQSTVVFNNAMRVLQNNTQFFRSSSEKNNIEDKIWLNLTSDNGVFNQILVSYVDGATNQDDGMFYDTTKNLATGAAAILYSTISDDYSKKYVIQGKESTSINENEIIKIGYKTAINIPTIYKLSIAKLQGDFLSNNPVYIKDKDLNSIHNLKASDYSFVSEAGEFNERFEVVFAEEGLFLNDNIFNESSISIIEHRSGDIQFKFDGNNVMKNIQLIDIQGRIVYNFKTNSTNETFSLPNLSKAPYIALIKLDNNSVITKKAIKRY